MSPFEKELEQQRQLAEKLNYFFKGELDAVRLCLDLLYVAHIWDDLIDKDRPRHDNEINTAFRIALFDIPSNQFYFQNQGALKTLILNGILQWQDSNILEKGSEHDQHLAWMLRDGFLDIFSYCAYLIGGPEWVAQIGPDLRRVNEETIESYIKEKGND